MTTEIRLWNAANVVYPKVDGELIKGIQCIAAVADRSIDPLSKVLCVQLDPDSHECDLFRRAYELYASGSPKKPNIFTRLSTSLRRLSRVPVKLLKEKKKEKKMVKDYRQPLDQKHFTSNPNPLSGLYVVHEELGSGGFGKVKLATHLLTGQHVAIKIIDKRLIGDDLPRVTTELAALKTLCHQNICRLYQYIETDTKFYVVMEYCSGGELFDYIVKKNRLEESEARHFFRQLVQAIAYVHASGFAHRDLKPENLLLTDDLHLKLIDFGLCANPRKGLNNSLSTCCGSPAYAAPELIQGLAYRGDEVDIWSMGVLLYTLLCGALPFEDNNMQTLYRKIIRGVYQEPEFLSTNSRNLLSSMLQVNPKKRITIKDLLLHPWMNHAYLQPLKWSTIFDKNVVDEDIARELAAHYNCSTPDMLDRLKQWDFDYITATYLLLLQKKLRGQKFCLPIHRNGNHANNIITSPTIHASLERDLDRSGMEDDSQEDMLKHVSSDACFVKPLSPRNKGYSRGRVDFTPSVLTGRTATGRNVYDTPVRSRVPPRTNAANKENDRPATVRVRGPCIVDGARPRSIYSTPRRPEIIGAFGSACAPAGLRGNLADKVGSAPSTPMEEGEQHTPRSATKTPRLRQRVFASLERKADRMMHLLTPRRMKNDGPTVLKRAKAMVNVSMTSSSNPYLVKSELIAGFQKQGIDVEEDGWKVFGKKKDAAGRCMTVELELVFVEKLQSVGIQRRRINGDAFLYKKVCEEVLRLAGI
uniref:non-specific serine/threonine protein kinase n=1 Tax=Steinernema glaseri TaxID=37863 RepID=A0A1I8A8Q2_9BILA